MHQITRNDNAKDRNVFTDRTIGSALVSPVGNARSLCNSAQTHCPILPYNHTSPPVFAFRDPLYNKKKIG